MVQRALGATSVGSFITEDFDVQRTTFLTFRKIPEDLPNIGVWASKARFVMRLLTFALLFRLANSGESCRYAEVQNAHLSDEIFTDLLWVAKAFAWAVQNVEGFDA